MKLGLERLPRIGERHREVQAVMTVRASPRSLPSDGAGLCDPTPRDLQAIESYSHWDTLGCWRWPDRRLCCRPCLMRAEVRSREATRS
jgi:hypothetical protein